MSTLRGPRSPVAVGAYTAVGVVVLLALVAMWLVRAFPFVHMESATYLANPLDGRPALTQILDVQRNDFGLYQARELSYATDWIDARAAAWWFRVTGRFIPLSLVQLLSVGAIAGILVAGLRAHASRIGAAAMVPALLFVSSASTILGTRHFRTAKSLAAFAVVALAWQVARALGALPSDRLAGREHTDDTRTAVMVGLSALLLVLADRQGTFFVLGFAALVGLSAPRSPVLLALLVALAAGTAYDLWGGPWLIRTVAHQEVNWSLQSGTVDPAALAQPGVWRGAFVWLLDAFALFTGALGVAWGGVVVVAGILLARIAGGRRWALRATLALGALVLFAALLKSRHAPVDAPDVRIAYYNAPLLALLSVGLAVVLARCSERTEWSRWRRPIVAGAVVIAACNLAAVPRLSQRIASGSDAGYIPVTVALTECIETPRRSPFDAWPRDVAWLGRYRRLCERYRALR